MSMQSTALRITLNRVAGMLSVPCPTSIEGARALGSICRRAGVDAVDVEDFVKCGGSIGNRHRGDALVILGLVISFDGVWDAPSFAIIV